MLVLPQLAVAAGPEISDVSVTDITETTAEVSWTTNTSSDSQVNYGTTVALGQFKHDATEGTTHNIILDGLTPGTKYYFEVQSTDASGTNTSDNAGAFYSFTTTATDYLITLEPACGVCGDLWKPSYCGQVIEVTAVVSAAGVYHICWDSLTAVVQEPRPGTFTASGAGIHTLEFYMPEAKKGDHTVYLVDSTYAQKASATFTVYPSVKIFDSKTGKEIEEGPVGTNVTLKGHGFAASQPIQVKFKGTVIKTTTANTVGSWTVFCTIPETPAGGYTFDVGPQDPDVVWLSKYFKVTPKITAPSSGKVGQTITVEGTGFASEEEDIEITFDGEVRKENISANKDGSWTANIIVPARKCGDYIIDASGKTTRARYVDDAEFEVIAGISVEPISSYVGGTINVTGGGFEPGETGIKVSFNGMVVPTTTILPIDNYGSWKSSFVLPSSAYGEHEVSASGETTTAVTTTLDTLAKITGLSSYEGAPGDYISLTGNGFHGSQTLTVTVGGIAASGDMYSQSNGNVAISFRVPKGSIEGQQTLVVTDEGAASDSVNFMVTKKTLSTTPLPISPKDSTLRSGTVTFRWQGTTGSNDYTYTLEISETIGYGNFSKLGITELSYQLTDEEALPKGTYYWRVKIVDDYGNEGPWSDYNEFRVSPIPTWVWVVIGLVVLVVLMVVAYRETKFRVTE